MMLFNGHDQACKVSARPTFLFRFHVQSLMLPLLGLLFFRRETFGTTYLFPMFRHAEKVFGLATTVVITWNYVLDMSVAF